MAVNKTNTNKKKMLESLVKHRGIVTDACASVGISRVTHYEWLKKDPDYKKGCDMAIEAAIDYVETQLYSLIEDSNPAAVIFYMKTKARNRGYGEHVKVDQTIKDDRMKIVVTSTPQAEKVARLN